MASIMTSRMCRRASRACFSAAARTEAGMPSSLVSSCSAVTNSLVPATLKSMSPNASSAPRMSVSATYSRLAVDLGRDQAHGDAGDRGLQRHTGVQQRHGRGADRAHRGGAVGARAPRRPGGSRRGTPRGSAAPAPGRARRARRGRSRGAWASPRGRSRRWSTAGSCSCACSACASPGFSVSSCCSMRSMFSVVTPRIWVSPRSNSAEPCTRGHDLDLGGQRTDVASRRGRRCGPCRG